MTWDARDRPLRASARESGAMRQDVSAPDESASGAAFGALLREAARLSEPVLEPGALLPLGSVLASGRFQILRRLGHGGMGVVYEVLDAERGSKVALKLLARLTPDGVYRLKNEFRSLVQIDHPNLVRLHELFAEDARWYYTMELVVGERFDRYVRPGGTLVLSRLGACLPQLVGAVDAIHAAGKLHRDLKPSNVLVTAEGKVVVLDFGLTVDARAGGVGRTLSEQAICGTPDYMAPEQAAGRGATEASDRYAVGVMLFEALTGRRPFEGPAGEVLAAKQRDAAPAPRALVRELPRALDALCTHLLAREPSDRADAAEITRLLELPSASVRTLPSALVGRARERELLHGALRDTHGTTGVVLEIVGESGVGKSALVESFLGGLAGEATVLVGRCHERESVPYKAFDALIDDLCRGLRRLDDGEARALAPADAPLLRRIFPAFARVSALAELADAADESAQAVQVRAFAALGALLASLRARGPLVVWLDDVQWADADSLALLAWLLSERPAPILWILSHRSEPSATRSAAYVLARARENRTLQVRQLALAPLTPEATEHLARAKLPAGLVDREAALAAIVRASGGNPLFALQLARVADGAEGTVLSFADALHARLSTLSDAARRMLELLALAGEPLLARVALAAAEAGHEDIEQLRSERLVYVGASHGAYGSGKTLECYHDRIRETLAEQLDEPARRAYAVRLAEALATLDRPGTELLCRALVTIGNIPAALRHCLLAADRAAASLAFDHAAELYGRALGWLAPDAPDRLALGVKRADALANAGRGSEAGEVYREMAALTAGEHRHTLLLKAATQLLYAGDYGQAMPLLEQVCTAVGISVPRRTFGSTLRLALTQAQLSFQSLEPRSIDPSISPLRLEAALAAFTAAYNYDGPLASVSAASTFLQLALSSGRREYIAQALALNALVYGRFAPDGRFSRRLLARLDALSELETENAHERVWLAWSRGATAAVSGKFAEAREHLARALVLSEQGGPRPLMDLVRCYKQRNDYALGAYADIVRETPPAINEAFRLGRVWVATVLSGAPGLPAWLVPDDPASARSRLDEARQRSYALPSSYLPLVLLGAEQHLLVYEGEPARALALLDAHDEAVRRVLAAMGPRSAPAEYAVARGYYGSGALRQEGPRGPRRHALRAMVEQAASALDGVRHPRAGARHLMRATLALDEGNVEGAVSLLARGETELHRVTVNPLARAALRARRGALIGGDEGRALVQESEAILVAQGVKRVDSMIELLCAGCRAP